MSDSSVSHERHIPMCAVLAPQHDHVEKDINVRIEVAVGKGFKRSGRPKSHSYLSTARHPTPLLLCIMAYMLLPVTTAPAVGTSPIGFIPYDNCMDKLMAHTTPAAFEGFGMPNEEFNVLNATTAGDFLDVPAADDGLPEGSFNESSRYCFAGGPNSVDAISLSAMIKGGCFAFGVGYWMQHNQTVQAVPVFIDRKPIHPPMVVCYGTGLQKNNMIFQLGYAHIPNGGEFEVTVHLSKKTCLGELFFVLPPKKHEKECPKIVDILLEEKQKGYRRMVIEDIHHKPQLVAIDLDMVVRDPYAFVGDWNSTEPVHPAALGTVGLTAIAGVVFRGKNDSRLLTQEERLHFGMDMDHGRHEDQHHKHHEQYHNHEGMDATSLLIATICVAAVAVTIALVHKTFWGKFFHSVSTPHINGSVPENNRPPPRNSSSNERQNEDANNQAEEGQQAEPQEEVIVDDLLDDDFDPIEFITPIPSDDEFPDALTYVATDGCYSKKPKKYRPCSIANCALCERRAILRRHSATWADYYWPIHESCEVVQQVAEHFESEAKSCGELEVKLEPEDSVSASGSHIIPEIVITSCDDIPCVDGLTVVDTRRLTPPTERVRPLSGIDNPAFEDETKKAQDEDDDKDKDVEKKEEDDNGRTRKTDEERVQAAQAWLMNEDNTFGQASAEEQATALKPASSTADDQDTAVTGSTNPFIGAQDEPKEAAPGNIEMKSLEIAEGEDQEAKKEDEEDEEAAKIVLLEGDTAAAEGMELDEKKEADEAPTGGIDG